MEEGSMRVDANVSVRRAGTFELGTRCEIKNLNSLRSLGRAIEYEIERQIGLLEAGDKVVQQTRHWNEDQGVTVALRSKEEAFDYRYFPEPDLVPVAPDAGWQSEVAASIGLMPAERRAKLAALFGPEPVGHARADQIATVVEHGLDTLVAAAASAGVDSALALARTSNEASADPDAARRLEVSVFVTLLRMEQDGKLSATQAKTVLEEMLEHGGDPAEIARQRGFEPLETGSLQSVVEGIVAAHAEEWQRYAAGEDKLVGFFTGEVMKATKGRADGKAVAAELRRLRG
jgi:aspartyl-tRNA(Asn)/glutamyl-tRNA(Gln) amidotransferase subunit B